MLLLAFFEIDKSYSEPVSTFSDVIETNPEKPAIYPSIIIVKNNFQQKMSLARNKPRVRSEKNGKLVARFYFFFSMYTF